MPLNVAARTATSLRTDSYTKIVTDDGHNTNESNDSIK